MDIVQNISDIAKSKGLTLTEIERTLGFSKSSMRKWSENIPSMEKIVKVAELLNVGLDYIVFGKQYEYEHIGEPTIMGYITALDKGYINKYLSLKPCGLTEREKNFIIAYGFISEEMRKRLDERMITYLQTEYDKVESNLVTKTFIRLYDSSVSAGTGLDIDYTTSEEIEVNEDTEGADFAVRVSGDSMEPRFYSGDIVLVESTPSVEVGEIGIFILNGQAFIKELGRGELISLNSRYDPLRIKEDDSIYCQGRVIKVLNMKKGA